MRYLFIALLIIANAASAQNIVKLSGKIEAPLSDSVEITYNDNAIAYYPKKFYATVDKKGNFSVTFPVPADIYTQAEIKHSNRLAEVILHSGDSLVMSVNTKRFDSSIHYKGRGSAIQNFVALHTLQKGRMNQYTLKLKPELSKAPAEFLKSIENDQETELTFLHQHKENLPASFISYWGSFYRYYNYFFMQQYPTTHEYIKLKRFTDTIPEANYSVIKQMPYAFNDSLLQLPPYMLYLTGVFDIKLKAAGYTIMRDDTMKARKLQDSVAVLAYTMLPGKSGEYFIGQDLYGRAKTQPVERTRQQYKTFKKHWPQSEYLPLIDNQVAIAERLAPGQPAPDFDITTNDGKTIRLSDLKGKVVYLSFWAEWCRQCVGEMISERKIKELIHNKPLEFVYVSIGKDTAAENLIRKKFKLTGLFTDAAGEWSAKEAQLYGIQQLPAYFLIDEEGKFAVQNPPTPMQSTELILAIERLFKD